MCPLDLTLHLPSIPAKEKGKGLLIRIEEAKQSFQQALNQNFDHWVVMYSGGKDSTTVLILALELVRLLQWPVKRIEIVYADTLVEIPIIHQHAMAFLDFLRQHPPLQDLPLHFHIFRPPVEERFWVCLIGRGYPPPRQRFRWCTDRLKIRPVKRSLKTLLTPGHTVFITGVRFGESSARDGRMSYACSRGGECGHGVWLQHTPAMDAAYLAPIAYWRSCDVWDFLNLQAPAWGYPTQYLDTAVYLDRSLRFGCWVCTVVKRDGAMARLVQQEEYAYLEPLLTLREQILEQTMDPRSRYIRPDGKPGRLTLETRRRLFRLLLQTQEQVGLPLITEEEIQMIQALWEDPRYGPYPPSSNTEEVGYGENDLG